jgi:hypothetical protein
VSLADEINARVPIVAHETLGVDCCGCLFVRLQEDDQAEIVCNECGTVVRRLPVDEVEAAVQKLSETYQRLEKESRGERARVGQRGSREHQRG